MTIPSPAHLFDQANRLATPPPAGAPRQVDLRRAISAAYYGVFHFMLTAAANEFVGAAHQSTARYALAYRSVAHRALRDLCEEAQKPTMPRKYHKYAPGGFGPEIRALAKALVELQERRHAADYDPLTRFKISDARLALTTARSAVARFEAADADERKTFLALLVFGARQPE